MADEPALSSHFGEYQLTQQLGRGGMGIVYKGEHVSTGQVVALKVLTPELRTEGGFRQRFEREAAYAASIDHPNVIPLYGAGEQDGILYMAMRFVEGTDLKALLSDRGRLDPDRAVKLLTQAAHALDAAHAAGVLHRDVKPGNIMIEAGTDQCYLTDFGLSKNPSQDSFALTAAGSFVGTIDYTAPEQILAKPFDHRVDVYSLACVLFECLTGEVPFPKKRDVEVLYAHIQDDPPKLTAKRPELPAEIDAVLARAMAKKPEERYASATEMMEAVAAALGVTAAGPQPGAAGAAGAETGELSRDLALSVVAGKAEGALITLGDEFLIGRQATGEGKLGRDPEISRRHALIRRGEDRVTIEDLGSTNGTFVNGRRIGPEPWPLRAGDRVEVGDTVIVVQAAAGSGEVRSPAPAPGVDAPTPAPGIDEATPAPGIDEPTPAPGVDEPATGEIVAGGEEAGGKIRLEVELDPDSGAVVVRAPGGSGVRVTQAASGRWTIEAVKE